MAMETDVSRLENLQRLEASVRERLGGADILMNNAGIQPGRGDAKGNVVAPSCSTIA